MTFVLLRAAHPEGELSPLRSDDSHILEHRQNRNTSFSAAVKAELSRLARQGLGQKSPGLLDGGVFDEIDPPVGSVVNFARSLVGFSVLYSQEAFASTPLQKVPDFVSDFATVLKGLKSTPTSSADDKMHMTLGVARLFKSKPPGENVASVKECLTRLGDSKVADLGDLSTVATMYQRKLKTPMTFAQLLQAAEILHSAPPSMEKPRVEVYYEVIDQLAEAKR